MRNFKAFAFGLGMALAVGCGGGDDDTATPTATPAPDDGKVAVTINVDASFTDSDGNALAAVNEGEMVYLVGNLGADYPTWDPQAAGMELTEVAAGSYSVTLRLVPGTAIEFKFTKTTSDPANGWANGEKDYILATEKACDDPNATAGAAAYLWEVTNRAHTVGDADETINTTVEAWRDFATTTYGVPQCY